MTDLLLVIVICFILAAAIFFMVREKRKGNPCVGCSHACSCKKEHKCDIS